MTSLTILRGLPGSGKSTLAKKLLTKDGVHFEADQYFVDKDGRYVYDGLQIGEAHQWCQNETDNALSYKQDVIVSNTFTTVKELRPYFVLAQSYGIVPNVILCQGNFGSIHNVPDEVLARMKLRFAFDISELFKQYTPSST